jgi:hypothetical protein
MGSIYDSVIYAIVRLSCWFALGLVACLDGLKHRHIRSKGWQLYVILLMVTSLYIIRNSLLLGVALAGGTSSSGSVSALKRALEFLYLFSSDVAESAWIFTLLAISSGFCVTRTDFGEHKTVCMLIPGIFLVTSIVIDAILYLNRGGASGDILDAQKAYDEVDQSGDYDPSSDPLYDMDEDIGLVFVLCTLINSMLWMLAWFYLYDTAKQEWDQLKESIEGSQDPDNDAQDARRMEEDDDITVYTSVQGRDDHVKTIEETVSDREKLSIMKRFFVGVSVYIVASVVVFFLPVFLPGVVEAVLLGLYDLLLLLFLGALLWVFRMRNSNQFVMIATSDSLDGGTFSYVYDTELGVVG